jgi:hypothetical protein
MADLADACEIISVCWHRHGNAYGIKLDAESLVATVSLIIERGICIIGNSGVAGGTIRPFIYNCNALIGNIVFWSFTKPKGVRVFDAICSELKRLGATHINAASHFPHNRTGEFYMSHGFHAAETQYLCDANLLQNTKLSGKTKST